MSNVPKRVPMYIQLKNYIINQIKTGAWKPGDKLPSENELAEQFNISRITVKNALAEIVEQGLVYRIQGKGSFISDDAAGHTITFETETSVGPFVALVMPYLNNLFTANLAAGLEAELAANGYQLLLRLTYSSQERETTILKELVTLGVKGIIIYPVEGETFNDELLKLTIAHFPFVIVDRYLRGLDANRVVSDNFAGAYEATNHLTKLGHTKISFISTPAAGTTSIEDRLRGYEQALSDAGLFIDYRLRLSLDKSPPLDQIRSYLAANPDIEAVVAMNSAIGLMVRRAATLLGLAVPERLSIVCFDNYEQSDLSDTPLTYIDQNEKEIGREAARLVLAQIDSPGGERRSVVLPGKLVVRASTQEKRF